MPLAIPAPGDRTARLYVWFVLASPLLLLIVSIALTVYGVRRGSEGVAAVGALGIVASLVLPRMSGDFEFGVKGFKGNLLGDTYTEFLRRGFSAEEAGALALEETAAARRDTELEEWNAAIERAIRFNPWAHVVASRRVSEGRAHEEAVAEVVRGVARERGWNLRHQVGVEPEPDLDRPRMIDLVVETGSGSPILIEAQDHRFAGNWLVFLRRRLRDERERVGAVAALIVVPDMSDIVERDSEGVEVIKLSNLRARLSSIE